jgi:peptidoglycan/xylan/chitin deacetylase (PgdA/CDA1 family)
MTRFIKRIFIYWIGISLFNMSYVYAQTCHDNSKILYLSFDTGNMSVAEYIADTLRRHQIRATFFLANEKTFQGNYTLDTTWGDYWRRLVADGHAFGTHSFDHVYWKSDLQTPYLAFKVKPQFGIYAGQLLSWSPTQYCDNLRQSDTQFFKLTGRNLDPLWRAPGGYTSKLLLETGYQCGYTHVKWTQAGFLGDELSSEQYPNEYLLNSAQNHLKAGDIMMAHLGIWSRKKPWATSVLEPLIISLKNRGFCFAPLTEHPDFKNNAVRPVSIYTGGL